MSNKYYPKVLVSTVGEWSDVGADTWSMLLSKYDRTKVASLYIRAAKSKSPCCNRYFHIYEERVMKSIAHRCIQTGEEYYYSKEEDKGTVAISDLEKREKDRYVRFGKKRTWFDLMAREFVWLLGKWRSKEFVDFIDDFNPEVLVFPIESYIHLNRINKYIIKRKHPKVIGFFCDDNFTFKQSKKLGYRLHRIWLRNSVKWLVRHCDTVFAICPKMKQECDKEFGINSIVLSKPMVCDTPFVPYSPHHPIRLMYAGKLYINRDKTIIKLSKCIRKINNDGEKIVMDVYSGTVLRKETIDAIECSPAIHFKGEIPNGQVFEEMKKADMLLFVEDLSDDNLAARLSFSTKITDCFGSGKCTWAIGNGELGPIDYFREQDAGLVSSTEDEIYETLVRIVEHPELISEYAEKGYECGVHNHHVDILAKRFEDSFMN